MAVFVLLLSLFWSVVCCQTFPYVSFLGQTLANHSYVNLSLVGDDYYAGVQCHSDLSTCCQGFHRGDWYFHNGTRLPLPGGGDIYESRRAQRVELYRSNSATSPVGIYRCDIATVAVHDVYDISIRAAVYVGLYTGSGGMYCSPLHTHRKNFYMCSCIHVLGGILKPWWVGSKRLISQGFRYLELCKAFKKFVKNHADVFNKYGYNVRKHIQDGICLPTCNSFLGRHISTRRGSNIR